MVFSTEIFMTRHSPFHDIHVRHQAVMKASDGWLVADHYGDAEAEYRQAKTKLAVFDTSHYFRFRIAGAEAAELLHAMNGNQDHRLAQGNMRAVPLLDKGGMKIEPVLVQHQDHGFVLIGPPVLGEPTRQSLEHHQKSHSVKITDETDSTAMVWLAGPSAWPMIREKMPFDLGDLQLGEVFSETYFFMRFVIGRGRAGGVDCVSLTLPAKAAAMAWGLLEKYGQSYGARLAGQCAWQRLQGEPG